MRIITLACIMAGFLVMGCARLQEYNPVANATGGEFLLNEGGFKKIHMGMSLDDVHRVMGDSFAVGYTTDTGLAHYQPKSFPNPYKAEILKTSRGIVVVEYYLSRVSLPDGEVNEKDLIPVIFNNGITVGMGADELKKMQVRP